jgi:polysaccharide export outer membrane protein
VCLTQAGCQSFSPLHPSTWSFKDWQARSQQKPQPPAAPGGQTQVASASVLRPRTPVAWTIAVAAGDPKGVINGRGVVGRDGTLELGPYGSHRIAGMTVAQADTAIEKDLHRYLKNPRVRLRVLPADNPVQQVAWQPLARWTSQDQPGQAASAAGPWRSVPQGSGVQLVSSGAGQQGPLLAQTGEPADKGKDFKAKELKGKGSGLPMPDEYGKKGAGQEERPPAEQPVEGMGPEGLPTLGPGGPPHGGVPGECRRVTLPTYIIGPPDVLQIESLKGLATHPVQGPHLVRPDGTVALGAYGSAYVAGLTTDQAKLVIARVIHARLNAEVVSLKDVIENLSVDVLSYNSKFYYVISDGGGFGDQVTRLPITGSETVLDAVALNVTRGGLTGLSPVASKHHIWVARPCCGGKEQVLPVDWYGLTQRGDPATNYQILPGDRVYVKADKWRTLGAVVDKIVTPFERILGVTLLGSETIHSIAVPLGTSTGGVP